jgi:hypothetical protein
LAGSSSAKRRRILTCLLPVAWWVAVAAQSGSPQRVFISFEDARPALQWLANLLPDELREKDTNALGLFWPEWVEQSDARIRARLAQGDEDSLVNLLLFGTSFTGQPRLTARQIEAILGSSTDPAVSGAKLDAATETRLDDLVRAAAQSRTNERVAFAQRVLTAKGFALAMPEGRRQAKAFLLHTLGRVLKEVETYNRIIADAERSDVPGLAFARRSGLYRERGLSSDTSLAPNFAIEEALKSIRAKGGLPASVRRVAVVGAGLDFADKQEGYDFYPQQTLQPFAVIDTLLRLRLTDSSDVRVTSFDVSPRVNAHLGEIRARSRKGQPYILQLPLDASETWRAPFLAYWAAFGDRIGTPEKPLAVPSNAGDVKPRAVLVRPEFAAKVASVDLDIILQRLELAPDEKFDLVVATNVFVYYTEFQQALAMANIQAMMRTGGILLSNNTLVELPTSRLRFVGETSVIYSERKDNRDTIVWYRCSE